MPITIKLCRLLRIANGCTALIQHTHYPECYWSMSHACPLRPAVTETILSGMAPQAVASVSNVLFSYCRKVRPHGNHYTSMIAHPQPFLTNQMTMPTHQPINIGIAHVVWPQPAANKRVKPSMNRYGLVCLNQTLLMHQEEITFCNGVLCNLFKIC